MAQPSVRAAETFDQEMFSQASQSKSFCVVGLDRVLVTFVLFARAKVLFAVGLDRVLVTFVLFARAKVLFAVGLDLELAGFVLFARAKVLFAVGLDLELARFALVSQVKALCEAGRDHVWEKGLSARHHPFQYREVACGILSSRAKRLWWRMAEPVIEGSFWLGGLVLPVVCWRPTPAVLFSLQAI